MLPTPTFSLPGCEITAVTQSARIPTITAHAIAPTANGPRCGTSSPRIHRYYTRRARDLPRAIILSRDRSTEYACSATLGAPEAQHVLDRWHLIRNLREALERLLDWLHHRLLTMLTVSQAATPPTASIEAGALRHSTADQIARRSRRARRPTRYEQVRSLYAEGISKRHIARQLQMSRTTVIRYLRTDAIPERAQSWRVSRLDPYGPICKHVGTMVVTMACNSGARFRRWAFQAHEEALTPSDHQVLQDIRRHQELETADTLT